MTTKILLLAAMLSTVACTKDNPSDSKGGSGKNTHFEISADWEDRTYDYGESIEALVIVRASHTEDDQFQLLAEISGGAATVSVEGEELTLGQPLPVNYQIANSGGSSATLHVVVTPDVNNTATCTLSVRLRVCTLNGSAATEQLLDLDVANTAQIEVSASKDRDPLEGQQVMGITLHASKSGFSGSFTVTPLIAEGEGYFTLDNTTIHSGATFDLAARTPLLLQYQPTTFGKHKIRFTVADGITSTEVPLTCEVYSNAALAYPEDGVYIYAKCYDRSPYFTTKEWAALDKGTAPEAAGIAILASSIYKFRVLIAKQSFSKMAICGRDDNLQLIPGFVIVFGNAGDDTYQGKENTTRMIDAAEAGIISHAEAAQACYNYDPENPGRWYLPSSGQLYYITWNFDKVLSASRMIGSDLLTKSVNYLTSTGFGNPKDTSCRHILVLSVQGNSYARLSYDYMWTANSFFPVMDL